jgi:hypothetical protein
MRDQHDNDNDPLYERDPHEGFGLIVWIMFILLLSIFATVYYLI